MKTRIISVRFASRGHCSDRLWRLALALLVTVAIGAAAGNMSRCCAARGTPPVWMWLIILIWLADARFGLGEWLRLGLALVMGLAASGWQVLRRSKVDPTASWALPHGRWAVPGDRRRLFAAVAPGR